MPNFASILDAPVASIEKPKLAPVGTYIMAVQGIPKSGELTARESGVKFDTLTYNLRGVSVADVDPDAFAEFGSPASTIIVRHQFMFNTEDENEFNKSFDRWRNFLTHLGFSEADLQRSTKELVNESGIGGKQCLVLIRHRQDNRDANNFYTEVDRTAPLA